MQSLPAVDFRDLSAWTPVASGLAQLSISADHGAAGAAMRLDFDFNGSGGFVVARRPIALHLPESYELSFGIRGLAPANKLELKLSDASGRNVWWFHRDAFDFNATGQKLRIRSSEIEFAWGPLGGGTLSEVGFIEFAIVAGPGGRGSVWIEDFQITDLTYRESAVIRASSAQPGHLPTHLLQGDATSSWRSAQDGQAQWVLVDFQVEREYGGLTVHWEAGRGARSLQVQTSSDGIDWQTRYAVRDAAGDRSHVYMPATRARYLKLQLLEPMTGVGPDGGFGIARIEVEPFEFSRSIQAFFHSVAHDAPRGSYPKYLYDEQTYWSPVGLPQGAPCALLNQEGMVEVDKGSFSIEPFLFVDDRLLTWADVTPQQQLQLRYLPIPSCLWNSGELRLVTTAFAGRVLEQPVLFIRYRVENRSPRARSLRLFAALRPFQVTPPWQAFGELGGVRRVHELESRGRSLWVDDKKLVLSLTEPDAVGVASFAHGSIVDCLRAGAPPARTHVHDDFGFASGALAYDVSLDPDASAEVYLAIPFTTEREALEGLAQALTEDGARPELSGAAQFERAVEQWTSQLGRVQIRLPPAAQAYVETFRTAAAHVLINRDGPALHPGPRRYTRAWIRDGATMAAALLRMGCAEQACAFIRWYATFQAADGNVPCCVDQRGPDWLVEHDSHGQLIFTVMECFRFTRDRAFLQELWPAVVKASNYLEALRASRLGPEFSTHERRAYRGLLPESASHEGYLAHPVHAYWDDFWALRGLRDALSIARALGDTAQMARLQRLCEGLREDLRASLSATMQDRKIDYLPGSVEWADFDPTATANAITLLDELDDLPRAALDRTFDRYLDGFRQRQQATDWANYTAYEVRIIGALVQLGRRAEAHELAAFLLSDRRPQAWNQWPEISWRDPRSPGHIGDVPHSWIGAEYILAFRSMLVIERVEERALVIGAGVPDEWLEGDGIEVRDLPTYYGRISLSMRRSASNRLHVSLSGTLDDAVAVSIKPPLAQPLREVEVNGRRLAAIEEGRIRVDEWPAEIVITG